MNHYDAATYSTRANIGYLMRRGASLMREELDRGFARHEVSFIQWAALRILRDDPALTAGEVCRRLHHDSGAFTRLVDQLEERGFLRRERSAVDRRAVHLHLTASGRRIVDALLPTMIERQNRSLEVFTAPEVLALTRLLQRLVERLERQAAERDATEGRAEPRGGRA